MTDELNRDEAFAERLAKPLRTEMHADASFEARVMSGVHAASRAEAQEAARNRNRAWWFRPYSIRLTPISSLGLAAGLAMLLVGASVMRAPGTGTPIIAGPSGQRPALDTVHVVRFVLVDQSARRIALVGTFNGWRKDATALRPTRVEGVWSVSVPLGVGRHEYAFVVWDGKTERWVADPTGESLLDDFGTESSVIAVNDPAS